MRRIALAAALAFLAACADPAGDTDIMAERPLLPEDAEIIAPDEPYSAGRDAHADVDAAFSRAAERGARVLVLFGGNWCPDCRILSGFMELPEFAAWLNGTYEVVKVDVGRYDRNMDVAARFGFAELEGVPTVVIADAERRIINRGTSAEWRTARERTPQQALDYFARYATEAPAEDAQTVLAARR